MIEISKYGPGTINIVYLPDEGGQSIGIHLGIPVKFHKFWGLKAKKLIWSGEIGLGCLGKISWQNYP